MFKYLLKNCASVLFLTHFFVTAQVPNYYSSIDFEQESNTIKVQLSNLISDTHQTLIPYTSESTDTWDIIRISDLVSETSDDVLLIYGYNDDDNEFITDRTRYIYDTCHTGSCIGLWNREHVFAKSLSYPVLTTSFPGPGTDVHNLRAADSQKNSQRSNRLFTTGSGNSKTIGNFFYPGDEWKGDVARIIMYMYLRYPGQCQAINSATGPRSYSNDNDMPNLFLEWNEEDPVSNLELTRNDVIYSFQGNRNPFIDNPYLATLIWNGPEADDTWSLLSHDSLDTPSILIYPTISENFIELSGIKSNHFKVIIYNQLGQILSEHFNEKKVDVSGLNPGMYILKVHDFEYTTQAKFIVK